VRNARSSFFPTDLAKSLPVPIFHINGDDPEAIVYAANLALQFRQEFNADCVLDIFCYRRHGHNEADEPSFTHPYMYQIIGKHPSVAKIYGEHCAKIGVVSKEEQLSITEEYTNSLKQALQKSRSEKISQIDATQGPDWTDISVKYSHEEVNTRVEDSVLNRIAKHITTVPEEFHIHSTLGRILERKWKTFEQKSVVDWSFAETLAFGSLLLEGIPVRLSGEDCVRGTFSQRHLTWWDMTKDQPQAYTPLQTLDTQQVRFSVFDSPLSEYSVVGFEYGYSLVSPYALVTWEAQFGDFANGAQVIIDNYITSAESKWNRLSGLILLLPHGCEGQGPDHSNARLERFLQLAACDNIQICNLTTPAQYFHVLRRQVKLNFRKPLIIMTPKSLLRHTEAISPVRDLAEGGFHQVLDDTCDPGKVQQVLLCSGKVYYDLIAQRQALGRTDTALIRIEQIYPFPNNSLVTCLEKYSKARDLKWVQEEPRNFGAWAYMRDRFLLHFPQYVLHYVGRDESPSSETGSFKQYKQEQKKLVESIFK
jgi:2-oxoglutarate dehydrogenase E1 component